MILPLPPRPALTLQGVALGEWTPPAPFQAEIVGASGARWFRTDYARVSGSLTEATLATPAGTRLRVVDERMRCGSIGFGNLADPTLPLPKGRAMSAFSGLKAMRYGVRSIVAWPPLWGRAGWG